MKKIGVLLLMMVIALPALAATKTVALDVKGWTCGSCAVSTRVALKKLEGVARTVFEQNLSMSAKEAVAEARRRLREGSA